MSQFRIDKDVAVLERFARLWSRVDDLSGSLEGGFCRHHIPPATAAQGSITLCEYTLYARTAGTILCRNALAKGVLKKRNNHCSAAEGEWVCEKGRAFVTGGCGCLFAFIAIALVAVRVGGHAHIDLGGAVLLFVAGGLVGLGVAGIYNKGRRDADRSTNAGEPPTE